MSAEFLPSIFIPIIGIILPFVSIFSFFRFIDKESIN